MTRQFDAYDQSSWYFGSISRQEATDLLMNETESGVFLVRDSLTMHGDYVLCVREDSKVSHYIINKMVQNDKVQYRIGDQSFDDLPSLLEFYRIHYLDTTPLLKPTVVQNVTAKFDFRGNDPDDLPFKKGDILTIISKDEDQWWTARNSRGQIGSIPVPYVQPCEGPPHSYLTSSRSTAAVESTLPRVTTADSSFSTPVCRDPLPHHRDHHQHVFSTLPFSGINAAVSSGAATVPSTAAVCSPPPAPETTSTKKANWQKTLPALARVKQVRIPNAYDKTALKLEVGDIIKVTKMNINGQWEGELNGKVGNFPFTHVEFLEPALESSESEEKLASNAN